MKLFRICFVIFYRNFVLTSSQLKPSLFSPFDFFILHFFELLFGLRVFVHLYILFKMSTDFSKKKTTKFIKRYCCVSACRDKKKIKCKINNIPRNKQKLSLFKVPDVSKHFMNIFQIQFKHF